MTSRLRLIGVAAVCLGIVAGVPVALAGPPLPKIAKAARGNGPFTPPACVPGVPFADITCTTGFDPWIEQFGADGITAGCGGGNYCPGSPVTRDQMAVFIEKAMRGTANWPAHTQIVWAVKDSAGNPDPIASGTALLDAAAAIPNSGNDAPSASNPWLLKVGPGIFDLGTNGLFLPAYVNLDGSGMYSTTITAANDTLYTVASESYNAVSSVMIVNSGSGANTYAVLASGTTLRLDHVYVYAWGAQASAVGIYADNSLIYAYDGTIVADTYAVYTSGNAAHIFQAWRTAFSAAYDVYNGSGQLIQLAYAMVPDLLTNTGAGVFNCIGDHDSNLAPVPCP
jgi:hypothetical protein